ncbi:TIGR03067 domain-containing protein [Paludisphaera mucosa]|uniref:TIGR03067 domain-containing protein n=1 Tax=Paludisphaera mucosa TaxID=3030827 RepID=A0ABT6FA23_9BACT|nr:TIGR03067 domain-containing protein [Paludisphaera mucosa]MDG3004443.1 TIGR03067 domain-containing protein [Paludisphaera mucosa]
MLLSLLLAAAGAGLIQDDRPTETELRRARQLLAGAWTIVAATDDGDEIGLDLVRRRMVKDGRVVVTSRTITHVIPDTGEKQVVGFTLNPGKQPREINLISSDERTMPGIYKIEGEQLWVCFTDGRDPVRPTEFESKVGSSRILLRLDHASGPAATVAAAELEETVDVKDEVPVPATPAAPGRNRATPAEIARDRGIMAGLWDIVSIRDDGESLGASLIRQKIAENGRVRIGSRGVSVVSPLNDAKRLWAYRLDPATTPKEIDLVTETDSILKGIYTFDDDKLLVCVAKTEDMGRPATFEAPTGSGHILYTMRTVKPERVAAPAPIAATPAAPTPTPAELKAMREEQIREMLAGSWSITDSRGTLVTVLRPDGTFSSTRTLSRPRLFSPSVISYGGAWTYADGVFSGRVSGTNDPNMLGYSYVNRLQSISPTSMVMGGGGGALKTYRKL